MLRRRPPSSKLSVRSWRMMRLRWLQGGAKGKLARAAHRSRQQQIGHVGAGDQQQEGDGGEQHQEEGLDVAHHVFLHGEEGDADVLVGFGIFQGEIVRDGVHVGLGLGERDARV